MHPTGSVLDMTCEHSEPAALRRTDYRNVPVLDLTEPGLDTLTGAVSFVLERRSAGDVYVHCAQGLRRSAIVAAACLLAMDRALTVDQACDAVRGARARVRLGNPRVVALLEAWRERTQQGEPATCDAAPSG